MKNWKTTLAGVAGLISVISKVVGEGKITADDVALALAALGLLFAKDCNVTGGTLTK